MSATADRLTFQRHEALTAANGVRLKRAGLRREARHLAATESLAAGRAVVAEAISQREAWLASAAVAEVLRLAPRVGIEQARRLCVIAHCSEGRLLRELSDRQRAALVDGLRAVGS